MLQVRKKCIHDVGQSNKSVPPVMGGRSFGQDVSEVVVCVNIFLMDHWVNIDPVNQSVKCISVDAGYVSHCRASAFDDHFDHCLIHLKESTTKRDGGTVGRSEEDKRFLPHITPLP